MFDSQVTVRPGRFTGLLYRLVTSTQYISGAGWEFRGKHAAQGYRKQTSGETPGGTLSKESGQTRGVGRGSSSPGGT